MDTAIQSKIRFTAAIAMRQEAVKMGVKGVATVITRHTTIALANQRLSADFMFCGRTHRDPDPNVAGDPGTDYLAMSFSKAAESFITKKGSGYQ